MKSILILNLMPDKLNAEKQFNYLFSEYKVTYLRLETYQSKNTSRIYLEENYQTITSIQNKVYDTLLITGSPLEHVPFDEIKYWNELKEIIAYGHQHTHQVLYICWGVMAGLKINHNIECQRVEDKIFGVYSETIDQQKFLIPHSRYFKVEDKHIELQVISYSKYLGASVLIGNDGKDIYICGHPEYEKDTLKQEYERDIAKNITINKPQGDWSKELGTKKFIEYLLRREKQYD